MARFLIFRYSYLPSLLAPNICIDRTMKLACKDFKGVLFVKLAFSLAFIFQKFFYLERFKNRHKGV